MKKYDYWLVCLEACGIGLATRRKLVKNFGSSKAVYEAKSQEINKVKGIKEELKLRVIENRPSMETLDSLYEKLCASGVQLINENEKAYPKSMLSIKNRPDILFVKGKLPEEDKPTVSIVGSRHATAYGLKVTEYFTKELSKYGIQIISGMAYGIDSCAHETALRQHVDTFAVMGCGIDICYPAEKIEMYDRIRHSGGIISEFPPGIPPLAYRFPMRNRIIAGLSDVVIVIEAREKSGSLITANHALEQGKDVYVIPGRIDDLNSIGCNKLWFDGAIPALSPEIILEGEWIRKYIYIEEAQMTKFSKKFTNKENLGIASENNIVYSCLDLHPKGVDEIVKMTGKSAEIVLSELVRLQLAGMADEVYRGFYIRCMSNSASNN